MPSQKTQPARGMRDFLPADVRRREYVIRVIKEVYERYGFEPLETPAVENIETLMGKYGEEGNQLIFKILKRGLPRENQEADLLPGENQETDLSEHDLALRYDLTVPLARVVAQYQNQLPKFFKRYQIQPVWRADRPARGRFREFYQCDVDVLGSKSMVVEAELCAAASDALVALGFNDFVIRLNHRQVLTGIMNLIGVDSDKQGDAFVAFDKLEKIGKSGVAEELIQRGVSMDATSRILVLFDGLDNAERSKQEVSDVIPGTHRNEIVSSVNEQVNAGQLKWLRSNLGNDELAQRGLDELDSIIEMTKANESVSRIRLDVTLARGLSYYTGAIMEINVAGIGSLGGGGRYDNLVGMFLGKDVPACGFSLGLERIIVVMTERGMFPPHLISSPADVMVTVWNEDSVGESISLATELRSNGLRVDLYPEAEKLAKQFKYASSRGIPFVAIVGDDERARGEVAIKDLRSGEQRSVKREEVADAVRARSDSA